MTDNSSPTGKLPEWVEQWLAENAVRLFEGSEERWVHDVALRAFLAKFVLCEKEPVGYADPSDGEAITMTVAAIKLPHDTRTPLYAPATKEP